MANNVLKFGVTAVNAGQKANTLNANPTLTANSTSGKFMISSPVSKALGLVPGDNIMFLNNIEGENGVRAAIQNRMEALVDWCSERGLDFDTPEAEDAIIKEFSTWYIAKGVPTYTQKGEPVMSTARYTKDEKQEYLNDETRRAEFVAANREALVAKYGDISNEELANVVTVDDVQSPQFHQHTGSKTATTSNATGIGLPLNFTDSNIWHVLKSDLGENKNNKNRVYDVNLTPEIVNVNDGCKIVEVKAYELSYREDADIQVRNRE